MVDDKSSLPHRSAGDYLHTATKAGLSLIPHVGGPAAEFFSLVLAPPLERRRDAWLEDLYRRFRQLEEKVESFRFEDLQHNEAFVSATLQATQAALRTHEQQKLEALGNAVLNVALGRTADEEKQLVFLGLIDIFTVTHLEILRLFANPSDYPSARRAELRERRRLTDPMVLDLNDRGLLVDPRPYVARTRESIDSLTMQGWTLSPLGKEFMSFIALPEQIK
jgi:hypothetical protein